jgi:hypothetical protein
MCGPELMPYAAVTDPEVLVRTPTFLRSMHPVVLEDLEGRDRGMTFVQVCPSLKYKFLWVHADNDGYRSDYRDFLKKINKVTENLPETVHVDHLYNRERAKRLKTPFIRLVLCPQGVNASHGAGNEKKRTSNGLGRAGRDHQIDQILVMKLCGVPSPRKGQPLTAEMMLHVQAVARLYGMKVDDIQTIIRNLIDVANFDPKP